MPNASGKSRKDRAEDFSFPPWKEPKMTPQRHAEIVAAATAHAKRNASDPFAYNRIFLHMKRGLADPAEVRAGATPLH